MSTTKKNENEVITPCEPLAEIRTPAAIEAAKQGKKNHVIVVPRRYPDDRSRYIKVDNNPEAIIPTEEEVEVAANEYNELKHSIALRKTTEKMVSKLVHDTQTKGAAL